MKTWQISFLDIESKKIARSVLSSINCHRFILIITQMMTLNNDGIFIYTIYLINGDD